jgi:hypothetical protein
MYILQEKQFDQVVDSICVRVVNWMSSLHPFVLFWYSQCRLVHKMHLQFPTGKNNYLQEFISISGLENRN